MEIPHRFSAKGKEWKLVRGKTKLQWSFSEKISSMKFVSIIICDLNLSFSWYKWNTITILMGLSSTLTHKQHWWERSTMETKVLPGEHRLVFLYSHAAIGEREHIQQQFNSRTRIALLSQKWHPFRCPLASSLYQPCENSRNSSLLQTKTLAVFCFPCSENIIKQTDILTESCEQ